MSEQLKQELEADTDRLEAETVADSETIGEQEEKPTEGKLEAQEDDESKEEDTVPMGKASLADIVSGIPAPTKEEVEAAEAENAKKEWKQGYTIYDWNGKAVYPEQKKDTSSSKAKVSLTEKLNIQLPVLQSGTEGSAVRCLQSILGVSVDGDFGKNTKSALKTFQRNVGIDDDGCCGQNTWKKIADHMNANTFK